MGSPSYMRFVVDRNVVTRPIHVHVINLEFLFSSMFVRMVDTELGEIYQCKKKGGNTEQMWGVKNLRYINSCGF